MSKITKGSANIYADMGLPDAEEYHSKAQIALRIVAIIQDGKLSQSGAAKVLGIDQPKVSALMRGKLDGFSTERLFRFLNALGNDVEIVIRPKSPQSKTAQVRVLALTES